MNTAIFENIESNVRSYCRSFPTVFVKAKGAVMTDEAGKDYIDFFAGAGALNYGHNPDLMIQRAIQYLQDGGILHSMDMYTPVKREFLEYFQEKILAPRGLNYRIQFAGPTGTNAVEAAIKLARMNKGRENIFAFMGAFHGMTFGSLALTTDRCSRDAAGQSLPNVTHIPAPYMFPGFDTIAYMETLLTDDHSGVEKPAAIILETVQADGGIYVFEEKWLQDLRALCDRYDILLIVVVALVTMLTLITMLRASGVIDLLSHFLAPLVEPLGMPADCLPLALLRPFSGGGALAVGSDVMAQAGPDSLSGRIAAVMLGSSDTSFYTIAVYSAYLGLTDTRYTLKAALCADLAAFLMSGIAVRLLMA